MNKSRAIIVVQNREALRVAASAARISTQQGTAMGIFDNSRGDERDLKLIHKVLSSGHKSVIEHQTFSIAFNDVSVMVEQFVIEARLASYTVKSRRYVDFSGAGYVVPEGLTDVQRKLYDATMQSRFRDYQRLLDLGVAKEDARFVLPYCLRSNFYMTVNARELIALICAMLYGRGRSFAEIEDLGLQLKTQFDALYPGVIDRERLRYPSYEAMPMVAQICRGSAKSGDAELIHAPEDAIGLLEQMFAFTGRFAEGDRADGSHDWQAILSDARPRELEMLLYTFRIRRVSLACVTHFTRHRVASILIPPIANALAVGDYVLPKTVQDIPEAEQVYRDAFQAQAAAAAQAQQLGLGPQALSWFALSGHEIDLMLSMDLRELIHFMKLRACNRAQWEIRGVAWKMLSLLRAQTPELFRFIGPSCVYGPCPEGRMSCGRPYTIDQLEQ